MDIYTAQVQRSVDYTPGFRDAIAQAKRTGGASPSVEACLSAFTEDPVRLYGCLAFARDEGVGVLFRP